MQATPEINDAIVQLTMKKGLKGLTMDLVARELGMSKRTLYEIYGSKTDMLHTIFDYTHKKHIARCDILFATSPNVMVGILRVYNGIRDQIARMNPSFFRDMDEFFADSRSQYEELEDKRHLHFMEMFKIGVKEGVFRPVVNFIVQSKMLHVHMEALKRMEQIFPQEFTLLDVYDSIIISFLRSIASPKGMEILDGIRSSSSQQSKI